jgi:hypothetical protein
MRLQFKLNRKDEAGQTPISPFALDRKTEAINRLERGVRSSQHLKHLLELSGLSHEVAQLIEAETEEGGVYLVTLTDDERGRKMQIKRTDVMI